MISIGISAYNQGEYLADAIESCLDQTVAPHEIIVVNDGSTDYTKEVAKQYPVKLINQVNKGLSSARNTAIMNATGDYFLPLDSDDVLLENCIEVMEEAIKTNGADVIAPSFKCFGVHNNEIILGGIPTLQDFAFANRLPYFSAIKKSVLQEIGGYSPRMTYGWEDLHLWMDVFKRGHSLCILQVPLVLYRTKTHSMITEANKHAGFLTDQLRLDHPEAYA